MLYKTTAPAIGRAKTIKIVLISIFAAVNALSSVIPISPVIGVTGAFFRLSWVLAPVTGLLLGPIVGGLSCIIAGLMEAMLGLKELTLGPFSFALTAISAFQTGLTVSRRWLASAMVLSLLIMIWIALPTGRESFVILIFHLTGLLFILFFRDLIGKYLKSGDLRRAAIGVAIASYCGNITRHLFGNIIYASLLGLPSSIFVVAMPFTLVEQLLFTLGATLIGTPLTRIALLRTLKHQN